MQDIGKVGSLQFLVYFFLVNIFPKEVLCKITKDSLKNLATKRVH